ncbi:SDR family oxidoreductase [bacterium]|jgi:NAD(P)-dependent dehydrogenase (short-subunit alcohol dehydrogenase family)|nr:SDR family oxidoreductase [Gammaproteobacteria bacterium]MCH1549587.1 SDR family oxidoreductase [Pseudomonadales bacterium]MDC0559216.1 SDR family oxidoreductase [bacterium]
MLENKNIIITGAGSGIGRATSILAAGYGANVVCVDLNPCVEETVQEIKAGNGNAVAQIADVSREDDVQHYIQTCIDTFGSLHGIYANAGVSGGGKPMLDLTVEDWHRTLSVNTLGVFLAVKHSVPHFTQAGAGAIVCTASVAGLRANAGGVDYSASKAGVISIAQTVAYQLHGTGIRINAICPGLIETGMTKPVFDSARQRGTENRIGQINPTKRFGQPHEIAEMACFLLSERASYVNGQAIPVDGGLSASHPWAFPRN